MNLSFEQIKNITVGASEIKKENGGICFHRFSDSEENIFKGSGNLSLLYSTSGIKMRFKTNSETLFIKGKTERSSPVRSFYAIDIKINGEFFDCISNFDEKSLDKIYAEKEYEFSDFEKEFQLKKGEKTVEILLPYSVQFTLYELGLSDGSFTKPVKYEKILMAYGDSITHGFDALHPSCKYITRLCDALKVEEHNKGLGGFCFSPDLVKNKVDITPDYITVAYGINDFSNKNKEDFRKDCHNFFENLANNYTNVPIFALAPIWASHATKNDIFGEFSDISKIIKEETQKFKNITFIDCFDFVPKKSEYFGDGRLHPNDEGFSHYFENLYNKICDLNIL